MEPEDRALEMGSHMCEEIFCPLRKKLTFDLSIIARLITHHQRGCFAVERIGWVRIAEELGKEDLEDVDHVVHGRPGLIDDVEADGAGHLIDIRMEYPIHKADTRALIRVLVRKLDMYLP